MPRRPPFLPALANALHLRCPNCHRGRVFQAWPNKVSRKCEVCGLPFLRESGYFIGGMILTYIFTAFALLALWLASLAVPVFGNLSENGQRVLWMLLAIAFTLALVRPAYSLWLAGDFWISPWSPQSAEANASRSPDRRET